MNLQDFTTELQLTLDENTTLKNSIKRYELFIKKFLVDNGGILEVKPFINKEERLKIINSYQIAFGTTNLMLIEKQ